MTSRPSDPILRRMIRAADEYWDSYRASYEDELEAWRERIAVATTVEAPTSRVEARRSTRRPARPRIWPNLRPGTSAGIAAASRSSLARVRPRATLRPPGEIARNYLARLG